MSSAIPLEERPVGDSSRIDMAREMALIRRAEEEGLLEPAQRIEAEKIFLRVRDLGVPMSCFEILTQRGFASPADLERLQQGTPPAPPPPEERTHSPASPAPVIQESEALKVATLAMKAGLLPPGDLGLLLRRQVQTKVSLPDLLEKEVGITPGCLEALGDLARDEGSSSLSPSDLDLAAKVIVAGGSPLRVQAALAAVHALQRGVDFRISVPDALYKKEALDPEALDRALRALRLEPGRLAGLRGEIRLEKVSPDRIRRAEAIREIGEKAGLPLETEEILFLLGEVSAPPPPPEAVRKRRFRLGPGEAQARRARSRATVIGLSAATVLTAGLLVVVAVKILGGEGTEPPYRKEARPTGHGRAAPAPEAPVESVQWRFDQVALYARKNPSDVEGIIRQYEILKGRYSGTPHGERAAGLLKEYLEDREAAASGEAEERIQRSRALAAAGDFGEARVVLSSFPKRFGGTPGESRVLEILEEVDRMEEALALRADREERERREKRARQEAEARAHSKEADLAVEERGRVAEALGGVQILVMNFSYREAVEALVKYRDRSRSRWAAGEFVKALERLRSQEEIFQGLLDLLSRPGERPEVKFASGSSLRVVKADREGISAANEQMTLTRPWRRVGSEDLYSILEWAGTSWTDPYRLATFAYDHGSPEWGDQLLLAAAQSDPVGVSAWLAARRGVEPPEGGYVHHQGEWIPKVEADHLARGEVLFEGKWRARDVLVRELKTAKRERDRKVIRRRERDEREKAAAALLGKYGIAEVKRLEDNGDISRRVDIVIVSDGFTEEEAAAVENRAGIVLRGILKARPFVNYQRYINVHLVRLVEEESGINELPGKPRKTKVGSTLQGNILTCNVAAAWKYGKFADDCDLVVVVANVSGGRATGGGGVITLNKDGSIGDVVIHELGHAYGGLDDEYIDPGIAPGRNYGPDEEGAHINTTRQSDPKKVKWHYWNFPSVEGNPVGCFEGAYYHAKEYYRPNRDCRMRSSSNPDFCLVCREQMERVFYRQLEPLEAAWPESREVFAWADEAVRFEIEAITIEDPQKKKYGTFFNEWYVGGERTNADVSYLKPAGPGRSLSRNYLEIGPGDVGPGRHEVVVHVDFKNDRIRRDRGHLSSTRVWSLVRSPHPEPAIEAPKEVRGRIRGTLSFQVKVKKAPEDPSFRLVVRGLPRGASFDRESGYLRWVPDRHQRGLFRVEVVYGDGRLQVSRTTDIRIRGGARNSGPVMRYLLPPEGEEGEMLTFRVEAVDIDGDHLVTWSPNLPTGATLNAQSGVFRWMPGYLQAGTYEGIRMFVGDSVKVDEQEVTLRIKDRPLGTDLENVSDMELVLALRSPNSGIQAVALDEAKGRLGQTFLVHEYARWMRFPDAQRSMEAMESLRELLTFETGGWRREHLVRFLVAMEPHCRQFVDSPEVLRFLEEAAREAARLEKLDKFSKKNIGSVLTELEAIRVYNEDRFGDRGPVRFVARWRDDKSKGPRPGGVLAPPAAPGREERDDVQGLRHVLDGLGKRGERQEPAQGECQRPLSRSYHGGSGHHRSREGGVVRADTEPHRRPAPGHLRGPEDDDQPGPGVRETGTVPDPRIPVARAACGQSRPHPCGPAPLGTDSLGRWPGSRTSLRKMLPNTRT